MNDVGTIGFGSLAIQGIFLVLTFVFWLLRNKMSVGFLQTAALVGGTMAAAVTLLFPAFDILSQIGPSYMSKCLTIAECRSDVIFSGSWIAASLLAMALQLTLVAKSRVE